MSDTEQRDRREESLRPAFLRRPALCLVLMIMCLSWATVPLAQDAPPPQPPEVDTVESAETAVIPAAEISLRATEGANRLRQFRNQLQSDSDVMAVREALIDTIADLQQLSTKTELADFKSRDLAALARPPG